MGDGRDADPTVNAAAWSLTSERVVKKPQGLDLEHLLDLIERDMKDAPSISPFAPIWITEMSKRLDR